MRPLLTALALGVLASACLDSASRTQRLTSTLKPPASVHVLSSTNTETVWPASSESTATPGPCTSTPTASATTRWISLPSRMSCA